MRKITSLLMLLCMFVGTVWAQVKVTSIESLTGNEELTFSTSGRGGWAVNPGGTEFGSTNDYGFGTTVNYRNDQHVFQLKKNEGSLYLFSVSAQKYVNPDRSLSATADNALTYVEQGDGTFVFKFDDTHYINIGGSNQMILDGWSTADGGNKITIMDVTEARKAKVVTVTYNFTYNSEVKYTQETESSVGSEFPEITVEFPMGVSAGTKPEGTITEDNTMQVIALSVDNSKLPFIPAANFESIDHWYYMNIRDDGPTFAYYCDTLNYILADKAEYDVNNLDPYTWAFVGNPIDGFSIVNRAAGTSKVLSSPAAPTGNTKEGEVARMVTAADATGNKVWTIMNPKHGGAPAGAFYIQHPTATAYAFNRQAIGGKNALAYWTGRDTGSSVQVIERLIGVAPQLEPLINEAEELLATVQANIGTQIGEYSQDAATALSAAIAAAKKVTAATYTEAASQALQAAIDATKPVMPTVGKYYQIHSSLFVTDKAAYSNGSNVKWKTLNAYDKSFFWQAVATADGGVAFKNAADDKFLNGNATQSGNWTVSADAANISVKKLSAEAAAKGYEYSIVIGGWEMHCAGHGGGTGNEGNVVSWNTGSAKSASAWYIVEVELPVFYEVTYQFVYESNVKFSTTTSIAEGADFPEVTMPSFLPYGITVNAVKPDGKVSEDVVVTFTLTAEKQLPVVAASDAASINKWYYMQMHGNTQTRAYIEDNGGDVIDWNDKSVANDEIDSHLWGFVGDVFGMKVVNKKTGKAIASTGSGNATMAEVASATAFVVTESAAQSNPWFCMKHPDNNNYLNAQGNQGNGEGCIKHWSDNDNGSSFFATEYNKVYEVNVNEYATLFLGSQVAIPEGVKAYVVSETTNASAKMTEVTGSLPAYTAVILEGNGSYNFVTSADAPATIASNKLRGSVVDTYVQGAAYVLSNKDKGMGFYEAELNLNAEGAEGTTHFKNNANRAYLPVPAAGARFLSFDFGGETAIENIEGAENAANAVIYDLSGRRVQKAQKGLYIVNGAKVIK